MAHLCVVPEESCRLYVYPLGRHNVNMFETTNGRFVGLFSRTLCMRSSSRLDQKKARCKNTFFVDVTLSFSTASGKLKESRVEKRLMTSRQHSRLGLKPKSEEQEVERWVFFVGERRSAWLGALSRERALAECFFVPFRGKARLLFLV